MPTNTLQNMSTYSTGSINVCLFIIIPPAYNVQLSHETVLWSPECVTVRGVKIEWGKWEGVGEWGVWSGVVVGKQKEWSCRVRGKSRESWKCGELWKRSKWVNWESEVSIVREMCRGSDGVSRQMTWKLTVRWKTFLFI